MWTEEKQKHFDDLWQRRFEGALTEMEQQDLARLLNELDREEEERLRPAMERMDRKIESGQQELAAIRARNVHLETIVAKREALLARIRTQLAQFQAESRALQAEYETVANHQRASV